MSAAPDLETEALEQLRSLLTNPMEGRNGEYDGRKCVSRVSCC